MWLAGARERFELGPRIGSGGTADVFRAFDHESRSEVAVKVARGADTRIEHEIAALQAMDGRGAPHFLGRTQGYAGFAMELLEGVPLSTVLQSSGAFTRTQLLESLTGLLESLAVLHAQGWVHGDIKPENTLVTSDAVYLIDFGMARRIGEPACGLVLTTPWYASPECWRGAAASTSAEMYAVGVWAHVALTGAPPFAAEDLDVLCNEVVRGSRPPLRCFVSDGDAEMDAFFERALGQVESRFSDAESMLQAVRSLRLTSGRNHEMILRT